VANVLSAAGADRVLCMDLHKAQIQGFFDIPVDHLFAAPVIIDHLSRLGFQNLTIVAPDAGGAERARAYAKRLGGELAVIDKRRSEDGTTEVMNVVEMSRGAPASFRTTSSTPPGRLRKRRVPSKRTAPPGYLRAPFMGCCRVRRSRRLKKRR